MGIIERLFVSSVKINWVVVVIDGVLIYIVLCNIKYFIFIIDEFIESLFFIVIGIEINLAGKF